MNSPVIIIGAGRSGTNILRDSICNLEGFETWPCDEINYIWKHGNIGKSSDRFTAEDAHESVKKFIRHEFDKFQKHSGAYTVVEKTCANSLRVPFIHSIFPEARYVFIVRNGFDVTSSAMVRWKASLEIKYILKKARFVPLSDVPYYGWKYMVNRIKKLFSKEKRLAFWGPIYPGMKEDLKTRSLAEVCAIQWKECVQTSMNDLALIPAGQVYSIQYEAFVKNPAFELQKVMRFLGSETELGVLKDLVSTVSTRSIGNYTKHLDAGTIESLQNIIEPVMNQFNKEVDSK